MDYVLLAAFIVYSLFVLSVGVWGYRKESFAAYAVADRSIGTPLATGAFVATFLSAITVIGVSGYASRRASVALCSMRPSFVATWERSLPTARRTDG